MVKQQKNFKIGFAAFNQNELLKVLQSKFSEKEILESGNFLKNDKGFLPFFKKYRVTFQYLILLEKL